MSNTQIFKELMKVSTEMNNKYSSYNHLDKLKCNDKEEFLNFEKKMNSFSIDENYNYVENLANSNNILPNINIDLTKIQEYYKKANEISDSNVIKDIAIINKYYEELVQNINLKAIETIKEKSIIYYLYYFLSRTFFYVTLNNNFIASNSNCKHLIKYFQNLKSIIKSVKMYTKEDLKNENMIIEEKSQQTTKKKMVQDKIIESFSCLKKYQNEFKDTILNCQNFLILIIISTPEKNNTFIKGGRILDKEMSSLFEIFITNFEILYKVNQYYSIIDYKNFYNDGISRNIDLKFEFTNFLRKEEYKKRMKKEKEEKYKKNNKKEDKKEDKKDNNKTGEEEKDKQDINEDKKDEEIGLEEEEEEEEENKREKIIQKEYKQKYKGGFCLFKYMWLFNPAAKNKIIILFNSRNQKIEFRKTISNILDSRNPIPFLPMRILLNPQDIFLVINIRRQHLIEDTLNEISKTGINLQRQIKVKFIGEQGVDEGGVRKEFFLLFIRQIFDPNYGMFNYYKKSRFYWFNHYSFEPKIKYELIGIIFGLAIYNNIILDVKFPLAVYKKLLGKKSTLEDLKEIDPELYNSLVFIKNCNDPNLKEQLEEDFTVIDDKFGEKINVLLKPDGDKIMVDINNKDEYIDLYIDWYFNKSINEVFASFEKGFYRVFSKDLSKILNPEELELIICGNQFLDFKELKKVCRYEEYDSNSETIIYFWEILLEFNEEEKKKFLSFVTGCDRAPIDGLGSLPITISNGGSDLNQLPSAHTCFNNLILPNYKNREVLKKKLHIAINYSEGFGLI